MHFEVYEYKVGLRRKREWGWHLVAGNGEILCHSEGYVSLSNAKRGADTLNTYFAQMVDVRLD
jgi:uncharacterized protein YegP (UPF0339 family)